MALPNARINFGDIMQAVEDKLVLDVVVDDRTQITWGTPDNVPQFSGPFDVLLIARNARHEPYDGGAGQLMLRRYLDIWTRSEALGDAGGGMKEWIKSAFAKADQIIDSVGNDNFWPQDIAGNLLTIESVKLTGDVPPARPNNGSAFGDYVCTLDVCYFPKIDPTKGP